MIYSISDTDYFVGGIWLTAPTAAPTPVELGAFSSSTLPKTLMTYLTGGSTVIYQGEARGLYIPEGDADNEIFKVRVTLNAEFSASPKISGTVDEIDTGNLKDKAISLGITEIGITDTVNAGYFDGFATVATQVYEGRWGSQFYGAQGQHIGGTFGINGITTTRQARKLYRLFCSTKVA